MKWLWIFTPWTDKSDYQDYSDTVNCSPGMFSGIGLKLFYPVRWTIRSFIYSGILGIVALIVFGGRG